MLEAACYTQLTQITHPLILTYMQKERTTNSPHHSHRMLGFLTVSLHTSYDLPLIVTAFQQEKGHQSDGTIEDESLAHENYDCIVSLPYRDTRNANHAGAGRVPTTSASQLCACGRSSCCAIDLERWRH